MKIKVLSQRMEENGGPGARSPSLGIRVRVTIGGDFLISVKWLCKRREEGVCAVATNRSTQTRVQTWFENREMDHNFCIGAGKARGVQHSIPIS